MIDQRDRFASPIGAPNTFVPLRSLQIAAGGIRMELVVEAVVLKAAIFRVSNGDATFAAIGRGVAYVSQQLSISGEFLIQCWHDCFQPARLFSWLTKQGRLQPTLLRIQAGD